MLPLHRPARFGGQQAVLVDDLVLTQVPEALAARLAAIPSAAGELPLYVDQDRIDRLAAEHPALPLYGLWQTLIAAGRVPAAPGRYRAAVDAQPAGARYLHRGGDGAHSGWLGGGARGDVFADAAAADECRELDCDPAGLALPARPIQTRQHRLNQRAQARRRTLTALGLLAGGCLFLGAAADRVLEYRHQQRLASADISRAQVRELQERLRRLGDGGRIEPFRQTRPLDRLLLLARHPGPVEIPLTLLGGDGPRVAVLGGVRSLPPAPPAGLPFRRLAPRPDGSLRVAW